MVMLQCTVMGCHPPIMETGWIIVEGCFIYCELHTQLSSHLSYVNKVAMLLNQHREEILEPAKPSVLLYVCVSAGMLQWVCSPLLLKEKTFSGMFYI